MENSKLIELIRILREETGISMKECKTAIETNDYDLDKARHYLNTEYAQKVAEKKANNATPSKMIFIRQESLKIIKYIVLKSETDLLFSSSVYQDCGHCLLAQDSVDRSVLNRFIARCAENLACDKINKIEGENLYYYIHNSYGYKDMGVYLAVMDCDTPDLEIGSQICEYILNCDSEDIDTLKNYQFNPSSSKTVNDLINGVKIKNIYIIKTSTS